MFSWEKILSVENFQLQTAQDIPMKVSFMIAWEAFFTSIFCMGCFQLPIPSLVRWDSWNLLQGTGSLIRLMMRSRAWAIFTKFILTMFCMPRQHPKSKAFWMFFYQYNKEICINQGFKVIPRPIDKNLHWSTWQNCFQYTEQVPWAISLHLRFEISSE